MTLFNFKSFLTLVLCGFLLMASPAHAQNNDDDVKSLGEILNPQPEQDPTNVQNADEMARVYYKSCMAEESLAFSNEEKDMLCACTAAHLDRTITPQDYRHINADTVKGRDIRGKVIAYAYLECVDYALESKFHADCMVSPIISSIIRGKSQVCSCTADKYKEMVANNTSYIVMEALKYNPMTLNPFEHYFTSRDHGDNMDNYIRHCKSRMLYKKHN